MAAGTLLAVLAALAFGATVPLVARFGVGVGPLTSAFLLYAGAAITAALLSPFTKPTGAPIRRAQAGLVLLIAFVGAAVAPTLLTWGLQRTGGATGSLLLNLEAVFTVGLAWVVYREPIGLRVLVALMLMAAAGALVAVGAAGNAPLSLAGTSLGVLAVVGATAAWGVDNTLQRALADLDPLSVVRAKSALGAAMTGTLALALHEPLPTLLAALVLLACGATGYGLSLRLYLLAQRRIGAARTGSIFAIAPFVGAALGWAMRDGTPGPWTMLAAPLFALGVFLHLTEEHRHPHTHPALHHEHAHRHDDGHHTHAHVPPMEGEHTHPHQHDELVHDHAHAPDIHHDHAHEA